MPSLSAFAQARPGVTGWLALRHVWLLPCILFLWTQLACAAELMLTLEDEQGNVIYSRPIKSGAMFGIRYIHSVALSPVTDYFLAKKDGIWLDRTIYEDFGAGLPHEPEESQVMRSHNGKIIISGFDRKLGSFQLRVGRVANHILLLPAIGRRGKAGQIWQKIPLTSLARPGSAVTFSVRASAS